MKQSMAIKYSYQNYNKWNNQQQKKVSTFRPQITYSKNNWLIANIKKVSLYLVLLSPSSSSINTSKILPSLSS